MQTTKLNWKEHFRIVMAMALKDITDGLRSKNVIAMLATSLLTVVAYKYLPLLYNEPAPNVLVYDAGESALVQELENSVELDLYTFESEGEMKRVLKEGNLPEIGLVIPADFDARLAVGEPPVLQGYVLRWVSQEDVHRLKTFLEDHLLDVLGRPVKVSLDGNVLYPGPDSIGRGLMAAIGLVIVATVTGVFITPHLILEEKRTRTMDVVLVSPATGFHVAAGKALAGLFYCFLAMTVAVMLNWGVIVQWPLVLLATVLLSFLTVAVGLLFGAFLETQQQMTLWVWVAIFPLLLPVFLSVEPLVPSGVSSVLRWVPTAAMTRLYLMSFSDQRWMSAVWLPSGVTLVFTILVLAVVSWKIQRDRL